MRGWQHYSPWTKYLWSWVTLAEGCDVPLCDGWCCV